MQKLFLSKLQGLGHSIIMMLKESDCVNVAKTNPSQKNARAKLK
jgi:hypothetical protein